MHSKAWSTDASSRVQESELELESVRLITRVRLRCKIEVRAIIGPRGFKNHDSNVARTEPLHDGALLTCYSLIVTSKALTKPTEGGREFV